MYLFGGTWELDLLAPYANNDFGCSDPRRNQESLPKVEGNPEEEFNMEQAMPSQE